MVAQVSAVRGHNAEAEAEQDNGSSLIGGAHRMLDPASSFEDLRSVA